MNTTPYWSDTAPIPEYPPLHGDLTVDVAVIGGGITGVTAAYLLRKQGASVALLERQRFAGRDTGHTTAHLTHVTDTRLRELVKDFGRDHAQAVWDAGAAAMTRIRETAADEGIDCEFAWVPGYLHAPQSAATEQERQALLEDAKLARELGFDAAFMEQVPFMGTPGVRFANQAKFHPRNYLAGLLQAFERAGGRLFENSDGAEIHDAPLSVKSNGHTITCGHVILATHVPLQGTRGTLGAALFQTKLAPYTTYAVGGKIPAGVVPEASFWDTNDPYDYLRIDRHERHDYAILGGADHKTGQGEAPPQHFARVEARLRQLFRDVKIEHRWSGQVVETNDGLPFIGEAVEKQFVATGYSGNGMTFGTLGRQRHDLRYAGWDDGRRLRGRPQEPMARALRPAPQESARRHVGLPAREQGLSVLFPQGPAHEAGDELAGGSAAWGRKDCPTGRRKGRRLSRRAGPPHRPLRRLPAHGLPRPVEWRGENVGLPLPRLALRSHRRRDRRPGGERAAGAGGEVIARGQVGRSTEEHPR
jgi:glycine/D-amino acid oxidase-like deaminating enzyme